jgi:hypothetical protein
VYISHGVTELEFVINTGISIHRNGSVIPLRACPPRNLIVVVYMQSPPIVDKQKPRDSTGPFQPETEMQLRDILLVIVTLFVLLVIL